MGYPQTPVGVRAGGVYRVDTEQRNQISAKKYAERSLGKRSISYFAEQSFLAIGPMADQDEAFNLRQLNITAICLG